MTSSVSSARPSTWARCRRRCTISSSSTVSTTDGVETVTRNAIIAVELLDLRERAGVAVEQEAGLASGHSIQFAYDYGEDAWLLEATATWMEERVFDNVNDNRQYIPASQVARPSVPLDYFNTATGEQYGNWTFFEYLSKKFGNGIIQQILNKAAAFPGAPDMYPPRRSWRS